MQAQLSRGSTNEEAVFFRRRLRLEPPDRDRFPAALRFGAGRFGAVPRRRGGSARRCRSFGAGRHGTVPRPCILLLSHRLRLGPARHGAPPRRRDSLGARRPGPDLAETLRHHAAEDPAVFAEPGWLRRAGRGADSARLGSFCRKFLPASVGRGPPRTIPTSPGPRGPECAFPVARGVYNSHEGPRRAPRSP